MKPTIQTIRQFLPLIDKHHPHYKSRYQVYYGGRGGRKSWEVARALITRARQEKLLILCTREIQNSIGDSVLRLLSDQIELLGLSNFYEVQRTTIIGRNGSEFVFKGLNALTVDSLKSLEGVDICWVEEAHSVSEKSWMILIPTIRKEGSQIFITFNPDLATDPVYARFITDHHPAAYVAKVSYLDNPHCPQTLIEEAEYLRAVDYDAYSHIWLGEVRHHSEEQVFRGKYRVETFEVDPTYGEPLLGADWGFANDPNVLIKIYIKNNILYVRHEAYQIGCEITQTPNLFKRVPEAQKYTIRADNARPEMIDHMKRQGFKIEAAAKWEGCAMDRVDFMRSYREIIIHPDCKHTAEEMRLYSYKTDKRTGDILPELVKKHDHCIDAIGYAITPMIRQSKVTDPATLRGIFF